MFIHLVRGRRSIVLNCIVLYYCLERLCATAITDSRKLKIFSHQIFSVPHGTEIIQPFYIQATPPPFQPPPTLALSPITTGGRSDGNVNGYSSLQ